MNIFIQFLYQPFFNLLIAFYVGLEHVPGLVPDMGLAVILLTLVIRVLMLPLTISATRTRGERYQLEEAIKKIQAASPSAELARVKLRKVFGTNRRILLSESINFVIQVAIFFILYRMFDTGLRGQDLHLIYSFMPEFTLPFNLKFLGLFDLTHPNMTLNIVQSLTILAVEVISFIDSPFPKTRGDFIRYVLILPIASFIIFAFLPSGKKLFVITTLVFSFCFTAVNVLARVFGKAMDRMDKFSQDKLEAVTAKKQ